MFIQQIKASLKPETLTLIEDYYGGWYHRYRVVELMMKVEQCDNKKALLLLKIFRTVYKVW